MFTARYDTFRILPIQYDPATRTARCLYAFDGALSFTETIEFCRSDQIDIRENHLSATEIRALLFPLSIALGISYYKLSPTPRIICEWGVLTLEDARFWDTFYRLGLSEFCYKNDIHPDNIAKFSSSKDATRYDCVAIPVSERVLVPVGGGKDSAVTVEIVRDTGIPFDAFSFWVEYYPAHRRFVEAANISHRFVRRTMDPQLKTLKNAEGYYDGHVPITGMIHFVALVLAALDGYRLVAFSNESSADEGNLQWSGITVNHQYSKSREFELDFREYIARSIGSGVEIFSMLSGLHEIAIAKIFSKFPQYHRAFSSCNSNFSMKQRWSDDEPKWCGACPKCAFVYLLMAAFLSYDELMAIFGDDYFTHESLTEQYHALLWIAEHKPFECVGTIKESTLACMLALENYSHAIKKAELSKLPDILLTFRDTVLPTLSSHQRAMLQKELLCMREDNHSIPDIFRQSTVFWLL